MHIQTVLAVALAVGLLLPALFRRQRRRAGISAGSLPPSWRRRMLAVTGLSMVIVVGSLAGVAFADGDPTGANTPPPTAVAKDASHATKLQAQGDDRLTRDETAINLTWLMVGGVLVLFMQAGFALVETGFTRAKNGSHTMMMNLVIFALGAAGWFICGFAFMFGSTSNSLIGLATNHTSWTVGSCHWGILAHNGFFLGGGSYDVAVMAFFFFQLVFMDATATIPTGAMAERWKFSSFCVWGLFASMILYPFYGNWVWGGGFLSQLGAQGPEWGHGAVDFAGSGVVHAMGGVAAFRGARALGPRIGKFDADGKPRAIPGHHLPMAFLGTMILLVGWMGFNGASTFAATDFRFMVVIVNTILASAFGCLTTMFVMWGKYGKPDPSMTCNGLLAGLVAITAPCAFVAPWAAMVIGIVAGVLVVIGVVAMDHFFKVDDPVGAVAVHGVNGLWGVLALGLFADGTYGDGFNGVTGPVKGLFYGDAGQFAAQVTSAITLVVWCTLACIIFFQIVKHTIGMRSDEAAELAGLDLPEMGALAYPDFQLHRGDAGHVVAGAPVPVGSGT